jgi:hypothetical protein
MLNKGTRLRKKNETIIKTYKILLYYCQLVSTDDVCSWANIVQVLVYDVPIVLSPMKIKRNQMSNRKKTKPLKIYF